MTTLGWGWIILGIVGGAFGLDGVNIFPGFILLFVGRAIGRGSRGRDPEEVEETVEEEAPAPRPLNTDRVVARPEPPRAPERELAIEEVADEDERRETLERILDAGLAAAAADERTSSDDGPTDRDDVTRAPISSAEMIDRARKRWDRRD